MVQYEYVFLGHDNIIDMVLTDDGEISNIVNTTRATAAFGSTLIDSETSLSAFDWSDGADGMLHMMFGEESIPVGAYNVVLTLYDVINTDGVVWDDFRCKVIGEDLSPVPPTDPPILISQGGTGQSTASEAFNALKQIASETYTGVTELATSAECITGTDTLRVVTPAGLNAKMASAAPERTYYVSNSFAVNEDLHLFDTIQGAIDKAIADDGGLADADNQALVLVNPGTYKEQIHSVDGIHIVGVHGPDNRYSKGAILTNDGTSESNYPLRSEIGDKYRIFHMNIETTNGNGILGKVLKLGVFGNCFFYGKWIENDLDTAHYMTFNDCDMRDKGWVVFNLTGTDLLGSRNIALHHCILVDVAPVFYSTHIGTSKISFLDNTTFTKAAFRLEGDWDLTATNSHIANGRETARGRSRIGGTGNIVITYCILSSGLKFTENPNSVMILNSTFRNGEETIPDGEPDITADETITDIVYKGNVQYHGICGCIQTTNPEKDVGAGRNDRYCSLQHAIDAVPAGGAATVRVWEDLSDLAELTMSNANTSITVSGQKKYKLTFTGDIIEIGANQTFGFADIAYISGGNMHLNGANSEISFESCQYVIGYVTIDEGVFAILYKSSLFGSTGHKAVYINNVDTPVIIGYSRVQGSTGNPAVEFSVNADTKLKAKFSTFIHGDKSTTCPLLSTIPTVSINIAMYLCGLNKSWNSPKPFLNVISQAGIVEDTEINF